MRQKKDNGTRQNRYGSIHHVEKGVCVSSQVHVTIKGTGGHNKYTRGTFIFNTKLYKNNLTVNCKSENT